MTTKINKETLVKQLMRKLYDDSLQATYDTNEVKGEVGDRTGTNKDIHHNSAGNLIGLGDVSIVNNEGHRYYDVMPHVNFFNHQEYCFSNLDHKTILLSALTIADKVPIIKNDLINVSQVLVDLDQSSNWHLKIISNYFKPYVLLNAFLTNNEEPQILLLGKTICDHLYTGYDNIYHKDQDYLNQLSDEQSEQLAFLTYSWHIDHPSQWYRGQLYSLDANLNWDRSLKQIDKRFAKRYKTIMDFLNYHPKKYLPLTYVTNDDVVYFNNMHIYTLDLDWFMSDLSSKIFGTDVDPVLYNTKNNQEEFEDPKIQKILEQLATNLT